MHALNKSISWLIRKMGENFLAGLVAVGQGQWFKTRRG